MANDPPIPIWTTTPREMIRQGPLPLFTSTTPDVAYTPRGSALPPIPYDTCARPTSPQNFSSTVKATGLAIMVLRSKETLTFGAEQGVGLGVKSGTIMGPVEPVEHSTNVRVQGSEVIRDGDIVKMNNGNNFGVVQLEGSTAVHGPAAGSGGGATAEEPGFFEKLWNDAGDAKDAVGDAASDAWDATKDAASNAAEAVGEFDKAHGNVVTRAGGLLQAVGGGVEVVGGGVTAAAGVAASGTGVGALVGVPAAVGGTALAVKGGDDFWAGLKTLWTGKSQSTYLDSGIATAGEAMNLSEGTITGLQTAAGVVGNPAKVVSTGAQKVVSEGVEGGSKAIAKQADELAEASSDATARVTRARVKDPKELDCFGKPPNATQKEFLEQLQEQEDLINNSDISKLMENRAKVVAAGGTKALRDASAQVAARTAWLSKEARRVLSSGAAGSLSQAREMAKAAASTLDATHTLDIIAGGDPSDVSGLQNRSANRSIGSQWKGKVDQLDDALANQAKKGATKPNIKLKPC